MKLQEELNKSENKDIKWVWYDYGCLQQGTRTKEEEVEFLWTLEHVNILYLTMHVLIMLDAMCAAATRNSMAVSCALPTQRAHLSCCSGTCRGSGASLSAG